MGEPQRNLAIYDDKVFVNTADAHIVALNARTGEVVWDTTVADHSKGYEYTSGPIIVRGKVVAGMTGCTRYKEDVCFITAHDAKTGKEVWRTSTIARPGEPGGDTWGDLPLMFRAGGDAWIPGSYDPATNLIYWGTAQAKPWARAVRGTDGDALYTNSTLALDPDTGKIVWYYQHIPGETHDMDEVFENILVDGGGRQSLFKMGKLGILWELDRKTGKFLNAFDLGYQTLIDVDRQTGKVTYRPGMIPQMDVEVECCPSTAGFKSWRAMAYHPQTQAFYIPLSLTCEKGTFREVRAGRRRRRHRHRSRASIPSTRKSPNQLGEFVAMGRDGRVLWKQRVRTPSTPRRSRRPAASRSSATGIVTSTRTTRRRARCSGRRGLRRRRRAFRSRTRCADASTSRFRRASAAAAGRRSIPIELTPEIKRPASGNSILVFALPEAARPSTARLQ